MRTVFVSFICTLWLSLPVMADIARPATLNDTLVLLLDRLLPEFPDAALNPVDRNITLDKDGDTIVNPDNIHAVLQSTPNGAEREAMLENFVTAMTDAMSEPARDTSQLPLGQIYPVLRHASFADGTGGVGNAALRDGGLYFEPYVGDMILMYAIDYPDRVAYLTRQDLRDADVYPAQMTEAAFANLVTKTSIARFEGNGVSFMIVIDGFYESSMMLNDEMWASVSDQLDDEIVLIVPSRDVLMIAPRQETAEVDFLDSVRQEVLTNGTHQLSDLTYVWRDGRWQVFED
ncbi:DUF1444 family protein [Octadecabacter sp.]|nr:DUF1444 family protein [Octadecabacter sp.]